MDSGKVKHSFLEGGGEMGHLIRTVDWNNTPIGDPNTWPQPLKTMVSVMLNNPFGMYIAWGEEYTQLYNDGYSPILGNSKHPYALGRSSRETFSEVWHIIESMFKGVMEGKPIGFPHFMLPLERNGRIEECYFDFSYSPIKLENGVVGGVLVTVIETTARKKAIEDLKESEERFRTMAEGTDILIATSDESGNATYFNKAWINLIGSPMDGLLKSGWVDLIHQNDRERYLNIYWTAFAKKEPFKGEFRVLNSKGVSRWLLSQGTPRFRPDGSFAGYISSSMDITEQKSVEMELKESREKLLFAIDATELGTWDYNPITNVLLTNNRLKEWFGLDKNRKNQFSDVVKLIKVSDREMVTKALRKGLKYSSGNRYDITFTALNPLSKKEIVLHAKGRASFNEEKVAYRISGTLEDITEKAIVEQKRLETEQHIRSLVLESPVGIGVINADTFINEIINDSFAKIVGLPFEAIEGKPFWNTFKAIKNAYEGHLNRVVETGEPFYSPEVELNLARSNNENPTFLTFVFTPLKDENGKVVKVAVWVLDNTPQVTARKKIAVSENNLRLMILQAPVAIAILRGTDYVVEIANKFALEIWGRTRDEVLNYPLFDSMPELLTQGIKELLDKVVKSGKRFSTPDMPIKFTKNGVLETVFINFSFEPLYDAEGVINGTMAIGVDVTPQVEARRKIEESEQNIRALVESAPFPIGVFVGEEMRITIANQSIMDAWGKGNDVIGKSYSDILPELGNQKVFDQIRGVLRTGIPFQAKNQKIELVKNGELLTFYYNYNFTPVFDGIGNTYAVMNTAADVTELHTAKRKVEKALEEIKLFKFMSDNAADPFILMDKEGGFTYLNNMALYKWGYTQEEMDRLKVPDVDVIFHDKKYKDAFKRAQGQTIPTFETLHKNKQGKIYPVEINMGGVQVEGKPLLFAIARDITERKKAEEDVIGAFQKVEESEKRFRESVKQAPFGIVIFRGAQNVIEMVNESYLQLVDKTEEQFVGKPLFDVLPEVEETIAPIITDIYNTGETFYGYEFPIDLNRHGTLESGYYNFVYHPLKENNKITGIMVVANEVTATVKAKHLIEENEEKLKLIIEASELGVFDYNLKSGEVIGSDRYYEILGFPNERNLSHDELISHLHPDDSEIRKSAFNNAFSNGSLHYQARVIWSDNSIHWIDAKGKVFCDNNNEPDRILGTIRDITEERNFHHQLLEREEKFRLLADSMPQHIWTADPNGRLNYVNHSIIEYSGLNLEQVRKDGLLQIVHPEDKEENLKQWKHAINTGEDFLFQHRFRDKDGEYRWQLTRALPQKDANGAITMWVGTSTDIQDQKMFTNRLEKMVQERTNELIQKNSDLIKANKELQSFVYISSHDLQEPLRKIQIFASHIMETEHATLSTVAQRQFLRMQKSAHQMQQLIQDLLAYSRTNVQEAKFKIVDLLALVEDIKETLREEIDQYNVTFDLKNACQVNIIPVQFKQAMLNLISNSIKFRKENKPVFITIDCELLEGRDVEIDLLNNDKHYNRIRFIDNGIGFNQQYSGKIFEVFQRLHIKEEYSGTGIGLAIVKKIVENHEGVIIAKSELNKGATFEIYLPV
ncbi:PAS domain-containing sensor histidine kinase [Arenibacter certesii]|uniref:histidine kinase n=1 Tax=Arenibacter certesii TaxID=228955 RepID=A0A918J8F9_9FLAO|nr:PAS domain S-box protein [Arenibacter certesii]GGW50802.1 hypothetical protein GCM10007383_38140 [Arenibacter certesii]